MGSFLADRAAPTNDLSATPFAKEEFHLKEHRHDRYPGIIGSGGAADLPITGSGTAEDDMDEIEITAAQKMLSAVSGSLLTSLLGMVPSCSLMAIAF